MKYAVIQISDGNFIINSEGYTDINKALSAYHGLCKNLYADAANINKFTVLLMNDGGGIVKIDTYVKSYEAPVEVEEPVAE